VRMKRSAARGYPIRNMRSRGRICGCAVAKPPHIPLIEYIVLSRPANVKIRGYIWQ
jgi:hypothetical protein